MRQGERRAVRIAVKALFMLGLVASCRAPSPADMPPPAVHTTTPADTAPSCAEVGTHLHEARAAVVATWDGVAQEAAVFTEECVRGNYTLARRRCLLGASTEHDQESRTTPNYGAT